MLVDIFDLLEAPLPHLCSQLVAFLARAAIRITASSGDSRCKKSNSQHEPQRVSCIEYHSFHTHRSFAQYAKSSRGPISIRS